MKSQLFTYGGGAGIGSYIIVMKDGELQNPNAEKIRWSYDSGENLSLSIIDESTEEALLPLTGYIDNEDKLHLVGRDFDDNKTYNFVVDGAAHSVEVEETEGISVGEDDVIATGNDIINALVTDKDILSQIVYDKETSRVIFPKGILPLRIKANDETFYFDYTTENLNLIDNGGEGLGDDEIGISNGQVRVHDDGGVFFYGDEIYPIVNMDYILFNVVFGSLNTYKIYNPDKGGTKLYKHTLYDGQYTITLISPHQEQIPFGTTITTANELNDFLRTITVISFNDASVHSPIVYDTAELYFSRLAIVSDIVTVETYDDWDIAQTTDTVTPL